MKLDDMSTSIRLRSPMEALDLGFRLVQQQWYSLYGSWFILLLMIGVILWITTPQHDLRYAFLVLLWLKPLYDRFLLHRLSLQLFKQPVSHAEHFAKLPTLMWNTGLFGALTWRRFSPVRSYTLPVWQLEKLSGQANADRRKILTKDYYGHAMLLSFGMTIMEITTWSSLFVLVLLLDPSGQALDYLSIAIVNPADDDYIYWIQLINLLFFMLVIFILQPFYVAAGFMLYLNRRTQLEAWDLEVSLRSIGERLGKLGQSSRASLHLIGSAILVCLLTAVLNPPLYADDPLPLSDAQPKGMINEYLASERLGPEQAKTITQDILQHEDFGSEVTIQTWVERYQDDELDLDLGSNSFSTQLSVLVSQLLEMALWIALVIGIGLAWVFRANIAALLTHIQGSQAASDNTPEILFGLDLRPQSLPEDIPNTARTLWQQQNHRAALSLLYRAALIHLTQVKHITIQAGSTEGDVLQLSTTHLSTQQQQYLQTLTQTWRKTAYGQYQPAPDCLEELLQAEGRMQ